MMRRFTFLLFALAVLNGCGNKPLYKDTQVLMGTFVEVTSSDKNAAKIVFDEIRRLEGLLSKYKENSDIYLLNRSGKLKVNADTFYLLKQAKEFWLLSDGAFDVTVNPLVDLWGFTDKKYSLPQEAKIRETLSRVGTEKIIFHDDSNMVEFKIPGMKVDLGGIAKGYAADCAIKKLREAGIKSCLINAGGQIAALGDKFGEPWNIAIKNPRDKATIDYLRLKDQSVSTSGDYEQYFIAGTKRYSHIFNPKTGYPADSGVVAVTVVSADGLTADALTTSIFVLGKLRGEELVNKIPGARIVKLIEAKDII